MLRGTRSTICMFWKPVYANDNEALIPEVWAQEALMVLDKNLVAANLVHRDFEDDVADFQSGGFGGKGTGSSPTPLVINAFKSSRCVA